MHLMFSEDHGERSSMIRLRYDMRNLSEAPFLSTDLTSIKSTLSFQPTSSITRSTKPGAKSSKLTAIIPFTTTAGPIQSNSLPTTNTVRS